MLDVGIKESTSTAGSGAVTLSAVAGFVRVSDAFGVGDLVGYCLISGNGDKEWGIGKAGAGNTLSRDFISATLVGSVFDDTSPAAISLTGTSTLIVTEHNSSPSLSEPQVQVPFATQYFSPFVASNNGGGSLTLTASRLYAIPFVARSYSKLTGIGLVVTTLSAGTAWVGVAESVREAGGYRPGRLLGQGSVDVGSTGIKVDTASYAPALKPGHLYWMLMTCSSTPVIRGCAISALAPVMGIATDGINPWTWLFANQAGPIPSDLSAIGFSMATAATAAPHLLFTS